jgi:hypothetical protein
MDTGTFDRMVDDLDSKISMIDDFIDRAHDEGISTIEAVAMQNHVRREFSPKQRSNFRRQIASLYRDQRISINQKQRMDTLLDRSSHIADQHFLRLSRIVPEGQEITAPGGAPEILNQHYGDNRAKKVMRFLGFKAS